MAIRIGLMGFGKAGRAVAAVVAEHPGFQLEWIFRKGKGTTSVSAIITEEAPENGNRVFSGSKNSIEQVIDHYPVDTIIDFSSGGAIHTYGNIAAAKGIRILSAVSHYGAKEKALLKELSQSVAVFWSPNITLGINCLLFAAKMLQKVIPTADIEIIEEHFKNKSGTSGTAIKIAETLGLKNEHINSIRAGGIVGKHEIIFGLPYQTIRLVHESISREAFGTGALFVAEQLAGCSKGLYSFEMMLEQKLIREMGFAK